MRIATWNVNSLRVRLPHLAQWLAANPVDAIGLQELKLPDELFPRTTARKPTTASRSLRARRPPTSRWAFPATTIHSGA
jgi:exonuclease III